MLRHTGKEVKEAGWGVSLELRGGAGIEKWVCRFGIHKGLDDSHVPGVCM